MDKEFHYYVTLLLYFHSNFNKNEAEIIANSCQFVDENNTTTINNPISVFFPHSLKSFISYHFIPGNNPSQPLVVTAGNPLAIKAFLFALKSKNPYQIGIATHALSDTWAHQNFCGIWHESNAMHGLTEFFTPNIGHLDAGKNPDLIGNIWHDSRFNKGKIHNNSRFIKAVKCILNLLSNNYAGNIINFLETTWNIKNKHQRISLYKQYCQKKFCYKLPEYNADNWEKDLKNANYHLGHFQKAALNHSHFLRPHIELRLKNYEALKIGKNTQHSLPN